jgi:hypothetical protein
MRSLISKAATVAIIVMASGASAGQRQSGPIHAILRTPLPEQVTVMPTALNHTAMVARILSFDANGDDRIARDELPERMEGLVSRGDQNQDGLLTMDEVVALMHTRPPARGTQRFVPRGAASFAEIIVDLKLPPVTHDRAMEIVKEHTVSRNIIDPAEFKLYTAMRELLGDEDYENFVAATDRLRTTPVVLVGGTVGAVVRTPASRPR